MVRDKTITITHPSIPSLFSSGSYRIISPLYFILPTRSDQNKFNETVTGSGYNMAIILIVLVPGSLLENEPQKLGMLKDDLGWSGW